MLTKEKLLKELERFEPAHEVTFFWGTQEFKLEDVKANTEYGNDNELVVVNLRQPKLEEPAILVTFSSYAKACEEADKDMHRVDVTGTFFERVCKHLGLSAR